MIVTIWKRDSATVTIAGVFEGASHKEARAIFMRADRLLSALLVLRAHGRLTTRELAKRLKVSERTVHRDMEALGLAGVPVVALPGSQRGWLLDEEWRTQGPALEEEELRALLMAQPRIIGDVQLTTAAERALSKLKAALPVSLRERATSIQQRLYVDTTDWRGTTEKLSMLPVVQDAVWRDRKRPRVGPKRLVATISALSAFITRRGLTVVRQACKEGF